MVEKRDLDPAHYANLPRVKTLGLRGCDISGVRFDDCVVPEHSRHGEVGAVETALRSTVSFAMIRRRYGGSVFDIPMARQVLTVAFVDILICDCMATAAARGLHVATEQFSVWSAVVKYFVPTTLE